MPDEPTVASASGADGEAGARRTLASIALGFLFVWLALDCSAALLGSTLGQFGVLVCALTLAAAITVERLLFGRSLAAAAGALGLGAPALRGIAVVLVLCGTLLVFYPAFAALTGARLSLREGWPWLMLGLFAQGGLAEETAFRGFLFGRLRETATFWRAAWMSMPPFVLVHLLLFLTLPWPLALASTALAVVLAFPMAWLYELGGRTVWAPAVAHFVVQGSIKLIVFPAELIGQAALWWMGLSAAVLWLAFLVPGSRWPEQG